MRIFNGEEGTAIVTGMVGVPSDRTVIAIGVSSELWNAPAGQFKEALKSMLSEVPQIEQQETVHNLSWISGIGRMTLGQITEEMLDAARGAETNPYVLCDSERSAARELVERYEFLVEREAAKRAPHGRLRARILHRDKCKCRYCGDPVSQYTAHIDHVVPYSLGGRTEEDNLVTACAPCNQRKHARTPEQAGMVLMAVPA